MPSTPYIVSGTVFVGSFEGETKASTTVSGGGKTVNLHVSDGTTTKADVAVVLVCNGEELSTTTNALGQYVLDLANLPSGYSTGDSFVITATDITVVADVDIGFYNPEPRRVIIADRDGRRYDPTYPFPVAMTDVLHSDATNGGNYETKWTITRGDLQPDKETRTYPNGDVFSRTFTYSGSALTVLSKWTKE